MLAVFVFDQVKLSEKLSHVQSLCIHEMIVRAFKHIIQAVIAAVSKPEEMAAGIAAALNLMLGVPKSKKSCVDSVTKTWLEVFLKKRFDWDLASFNYTELRKIAILRGLCHKVIDSYRTECTLPPSSILNIANKFVLYRFSRLALSWFQEILI